MLTINLHNNNNNPIQFSYLTLDLQFSHDGPAIKIGIPCLNVHAGLLHSANRSCNHKSVQVIDGNTNPKNDILRNTSISK